MKQHQFRVTLEYLADKDGHATHAAPMVFDAPNHDNIFDIIDMVKQQEGFTDEMACRFVTGLKLMGEVMLENKDHPLFVQLKPHFMEMMKVIKNKTNSCTTNAV